MKALRYISGLALVCLGSAVWGQEGVSLEDLLGEARVAKSEGQPEKALRLLERAMSAAPDTADLAGYIRQSKEAFGMMAELHAGNGDYAQALQASEVYKFIADSLAKVEGSRQLGQAEERSRLELELAKAAAAKRRAAEAERQAFAERDLLQYTGIAAGVALAALLAFVAGRQALPERLRGSMAFFAALALFEFALLLVDQYSQGFTQEAPVRKMAVNTLVAVLFTPVAELLERRLARRGG